MTALLQGGPVQFEMGYPSNDQWKKRQGKRVIIQTDIGRNQTKTDVMHCDDFDLELVRELAGELPDGFGSAAAARVMNHLAQTEVVSCEKTGAAYHVEIEGGAGLNGSFDLAVPTEEAMLKFERSNYGVITQGKQRRIVTNLFAGAELFEAMGGNKDTSILHQFAAAQAIVEALNSLTATEDFR